VRNFSAILWGEQVEMI